MTVTLNSRFETIATIPPVAPLHLLKSEPMLWSASPNYAALRGGQLTRDFIGFLPVEWRNDDRVVIDSRVHMLMPGWWPAIPGWHLDDVPRSGPDNQPNYIAPEYEAEQIALLISTDGKICPTSFLSGRVELPKPPEGELVYEFWNREINARIDRGELREELFQHGEVVWFDWQGLHRANASTGNGWRFFIRATRGSRRPGDEPGPQPSPSVPLGPREGLVMRRQESPVYLDDCTIIRESDKAFQVDIAGESHWIPKSQIIHSESITEVGEEGTLVITRWLAAQKELTP